MTQLRDIPAASMNICTGISNVIADQNYQAQETCSLNIIVFSVGDVVFGIDADHVAEIASYNGEDADDLLWVHKELVYGGMEVSYVSPTVLSIMTESEKLYRLVIDNMKDISECSMADVRPFPALLEPFSLPYGLWGILSVQGTMILLLDCHLLLKQKINISKIDTPE
jgi:chemotaxis signal transduction protein